MSKKYTGLPGLRGYAAAAKVARYGDFTSSRGSADYELREGLAEVRAKVRYLARNSSSMKRFLNLMHVNVVGEHGFRLQSRVRRNDGSLASALNTRVEEAWAEWCEAPTACGQMHMVDLCEQAIRALCRDGEFIWEVYFNGDSAEINPIEADQLDETKNEVYPPTGNEIRMGVEINDKGRPVAYHFLTQHPGDAVSYDLMLRNRHRRVTADRVLHVFKKERVGQTRGEPPAASMVLGVKMLDGYREAETMGRRLRSALMGFFTSDMPPTAQIEQLADRPDEDQELFEMDMEPGRMKQLPHGMRFEEFSPGGSTTDYAEFEQQAKKDIAMGVNISTMSHGMEVSGVSYSSGRTVIQEDREFYKTVQQFMIRRAMKPLFRMWQRFHLISANPSFTSTQISTVYRSCVFRPRGWDWVDPSKDVSANTEALMTGQTSLTRVAASRGMDISELMAEIAAERELAAQYGLTLDYSGGNGGQVNEDENAEP